MFYDFRVYKDDVNDPEFNEKDKDDKDKYPQNDAWFKAIKDQYFALVDK